MGSMRRRLLLAFLAPTLAVVASLPSLRVPFLYDDVATVVDNPSLADLGNWTWILTYERFRPLVNVSHALERAAFGLSSAGHHLTNVLLHALNVVLLQLLAARVGARPSGAEAGSALASLAASVWAVHPVMTSAVGYVSARADLMAATGILATLLGHEAWAATGRRRFLVLMLLAFAGALLCKETAAVAPLLMLLRSASMGVSARGGRLVYAGLLSVVAAGGTFRVLAFFLEESRLPRLLWWRYPLTEAGVAFRYVALLVFPRGQSIVHSVPFVTRPTEPGALFPLAGLLLVGLLALRLRHRRPAAALGLAGFLLCLAPSSVVPLAQVMAEHRLYVPAAFLFVAAADLAASLRVPRRAALAATAALLGTLTGLTILRYEVWRDPVALWSEGVARAPDLFAPHYWLAEALRSSGRCAEATRHYLTSIAIIPADPLPYRGLAVCLRASGAMDEEVVAALRHAARHGAPGDADRCLRIVEARWRSSMSM